jgi:hypothetical protein
MGDQGNFQDWLREIAEEIGRSVERLSEVDLDDLASRYGVDADRARAFTDAAGRWLTSNAPLFGSGPTDAAAPGRERRPETGSHHADVPTPPGPHPLDVPTDWQGLALSALDSGRWTLSAGSNQLSATGDGLTPPADASDLVGELRARDWISSDGTVTLVGRHALTRWCAKADDPSSG